jgi:hypothetical protein
VLWLVKLCLTSTSFFFDVAILYNFYQYTFVSEVEHTLKMYSESKRTIFSNFHESVTDFKVANCGSLTAKLKEKVTLLIGFPRTLEFFTKKLLVNLAHPQPVRYMNENFFHMSGDNGLLCVIPVDIKWTLPDVLGKKFFLKQTKKVRILIAMKRDDIYKGDKLIKFTKALDLMMLPHQASSVGMVITFDNPARGFQIAFKFNMVEKLQKMAYPNSYLQMFNHANVFPILFLPRDGPKLLDEINKSVKYANCTEKETAFTFDNHMLTILKEQFDEINHNHESSSREIEKILSKPRSVKYRSNLQALLDQYFVFLHENAKKFNHNLYNIDHFRKGHYFFKYVFKKKFTLIQTSNSDAWENLAATRQYNETKMFSDIMRYHLKSMEVLDRIYLTQNVDLIKIRRIIYHVLENLEEDLKKQRMKWLKQIVCVGNERVPPEVSEVIELIDDTRAYVALQWLNMPLTRNTAFQIHYTKYESDHEKLVTDIENAFIQTVCYIVEETFQAMLVNVTSSFGKVSNNAENITTHTKELSTWLRRFPSSKETSFRFKYFINFLNQYNFVLSMETEQKLRNLENISARSDLKIIDPDGRIVFSYVTKTLDVELQKMFSRFKINISRVIVPKMIKNQENLVDQAVMSLDQSLFEGLKETFDIFEPEAWRQVTIQPFYRLLNLKENSYSINSFVTLLELYFKIHWVDADQTDVWSDLEKVKEKFSTIEEMLEIPINTNHQWGKMLQKSTDYLLIARSSANRPYSPVNQAADWMTTAYYSVCFNKPIADDTHGFSTAMMVRNDAFKIDNEYFYGFFNVIIILFLFVKSIFKF